MPTEIQRNAQELQCAIIDNDYYVKLYSAALKRHGMTADGVDEAEFTDAKLVDMANTFWFALPDSPSIRREPFFQLCNIAEHCFDGPEDDD